LVRRASIPGRDLIPLGAAPPNPSEWLLQSRFQALVDKLDRNCDYVLIDSPSVLAVTDAAIVGNAAHHPAGGPLRSQHRAGDGPVPAAAGARGVTLRVCIFSSLERRAVETYGHYAYYQYRYGEAPGTIRRGKAGNNPPPTREQLPNRRR